MKHNNNTKKQTKNICNLNQKEKSDVDPLVELEIKGYHVRQVVLDFGLQVNIMTRNTWEQLGRHRLYDSGIYLKIANQRFDRTYRSLEKCRYDNKRNIDQS